MREKCARYANGTLAGLPRSLVHHYREYRRFVALGNIKRRATKRGTLMQVFRNLRLFYQSILIPALIFLVERLFDTHIIVPSAKASALFASGATI
jgi:hypothetical protein